MENTGKSHLVKVKYNAISNTLKKKTPEKPKVLLLGPKGLSTMHIGVTTIHFGIGIKPGTTLLGLNNKSKAVLRNKLSEVKFFVKYELSMVLIDL